MNAIEKFAKEHGRDIDKSLASKFQQAVESVIGDRGRVIDAWVDFTGNRLHPIEWKVSIVSDDMEDDGREICLELITDFEGKSHFICDFWDRDSNLIASEVGEVGEFDPLPLIDKVLGKSESKKSEDTGADTSALLHLQTKGDGNEQAVHEFLDDLYLNNRARLGGFVRIYSKDLGEVIGVYADSKKPEVLAEYLKLYAKEYIVRQDMHDGNWTEAEDVLPYILDCLQELVRKGGVPCKEQSNDTLVANGVSATVGENGTIYVKDRVSDHIDGCDTTEDAAKRFIALWQKHNLNKGESKKPESCKDGKKESMERCDSCGAVMTEYDYDRYGGLCKYCRDKGEAKKSEALTKDTTVVGQIDNSSLKWIERTLGQIKKKFPGVEADSRGNTITIRGKLADVSAVCDAYPKGISHLHQDKGGDFLPNAAGDDLDYGEVDKVLSESKKSEGANALPTKEEMKRVVDGLKKDKAFSRRYSVDDSVLYGAIDSEWSPVMSITDKKTGKTYATILFDGDGKIRINGFPYSPIEGDSSDIDWILEVLRNKKPSESKKSEGIGDRIKMGIDYNMFMRMCRTAAYLDEDEDYWDALWEYYSEMGEIEDALVFFDNLFQYTAWCDADELYDEYLDDKFKDDSKSKEECIEAAIDDGDLQAYKHEKGNYLVIL